MNRYHPKHIIKHSYRNPLFFGNRGGTDKWGHKKEKVIRKHWHPDLTIPTGLKNGVVLDFGMPEKNGLPWMYARKVNGNIVKAFDSAGNFRYEFCVGYGGDEHITRLWDINGDGKDELITIQDGGVAVKNAVTGAEMSWHKLPGKYEKPSMAICADGDIITLGHYCSDMDKWHWNGSALEQVGAHFGCDGKREACHFPRSGYGIICAGWYWFDYNMNRLRQPHQFKEWVEFFNKDHCDGCWVVDDGVILSAQTMNKIFKYDHSGNFQWQFQYPGTTAHYHNMRVDEKNGQIMFTEEGHNPPRVFILDMPGHVLPGFPIECLDQCQADYFQSPDYLSLYISHRDGNKAGIVNPQGELVFNIGQQAEFYNQKHSYYGTVFYASKNGEVRTINVPEKKTDVKPNLVLSRDKLMEQQNLKCHRG